MFNKNYLRDVGHIGTGVRRDVRGYRQDFKCKSLQQTTLFDKSTRGNRNLVNWSSVDGEVVKLGL